MIDTILFFAFAGLLSGSVLNMVVYRLPIMLSETPSARPFNLWWPGSHCCHCQHPLAIKDNIPLLSWCLLQGRCRYCHQKIAWRYPILELICTLAGAGCAFAWPQPHIAGAIYLYFWFALALSIIDFRAFLLPDKLTLPLLWLGLLFNTQYGILPLSDAIYGAAAGYVILWCIYWAVWLISRKEGLGYGDFKLLAAAGAWCGWQSLPTILLLASLGGIIFTVGAKICRRQKSSIIAFGPWLAFSSWLYFCYLMWG